MPRASMARMDEDRAAVVVAERPGVVPGALDQGASDFEAFFLREHVALRKTAGWMPHDDQLELVESRDSVVRAMASLSPRQRAAVVLIDVLGLSSEQAGTALGVKAVTVRVQAARGREALRKAMGDHD